MSSLKNSLSLITNKHKEKYVPLSSSIDEEDIKNETKIEDKKNNLQKKGNQSNIKIIDFFTVYGKQRVTIHGNLTENRPLIVTYHDIGINHNACYDTFFNMAKSTDNIFEYFTIIHIDVPGHYSTSKNKKTTTPTNFDCFDLLELATQIETIRNKLQLKPFMALGIGAACNVWSYYAMNFSERLKGMVLINPLASVAGWREWMADQLLSVMGTESEFMISSLKDSLINRYFPGCAWSQTLQYFWNEIESNDIQSVIHYFRGFTRRTELTEHMLANIKCQCLVLCGRRSGIKSETIEYQKRMPRKYTQFVLIDKCGFFATETHPQLLIQPILFFLPTLGISKISLEWIFGKIEEED